MSKIKILSAIIYLALSFTFFESLAVDWLITTSGTYQLDDDILSTGDATNGTISIQSSYVTLDLNTCFIQQTTNTAGCNGIVLAPGVTDVTIKNGTILNFTGTGILVNSGSSKIIIDNILTDSCFASGISFAGTVSSPISDSQIQNSRILRCANSATVANPAGAPAVWLQNCNNCYVNNCRITTSGIFQAAANSNLYGCLELDACNNCLVENVNMYNNQQYGAVSLNQLGGSGSGSTGCIIRGCNVSGSSGAFPGLPYTSGIPGLYKIQGNSTNNLFSNCLATGNNASSGALLCFAIGASSNSFIACNASNNIVSSAIYGLVGFGMLSGFTANSCLLIDCVFANNSNSQTTTGFLIAYSNHLLQGCIASYNTSSAFCFGFQISGSLIELKDCQAVYNNGNNDSNSYGILSSANCLFVGNVSYANGPTNPLVANQLSGVPLTSLTTPGRGGAGNSSTRMSSAMSPWGNLRITK